MSSRAQRSKALVSFQVSGFSKLVPQQAPFHLPALQLRTGTFHQPSRGPDAHQESAKVKGADKSRIHQGTGWGSNQTGCRLQSCGEDGACLGRGDWGSICFLQPQQHGWSMHSGSSFRLHPPCARAQRESERHLSAAFWLRAVWCFPWGWAASGIDPRKPHVTTTQPSGQCKHASVACLGHRAISARL